MCAGYGFYIQGGVDSYGCLYVCHVISIGVTSCSWNLGFAIFWGLCILLGDVWGWVQECAEGVEEVLGEKDGEEGEKGKEREELPKTPRKVKVEALDGTIEQVNSSALVSISRTRRACID